jgi:hypothetical protein
VNAIVAEMILIEHNDGPKPHATVINSNPRRYHSRRDNTALKDLQQCIASGCCTMRVRRLLSVHLRLGLVVERNYSAYVFIDVDG